MASIVFTYKNLQDFVLRWLDEAGDTTTTLALVKDALVSAQKLRVSQQRWPFMLWYEPELLNIVAGQQLYTLHPEYNRPLYFWNRTQLDYCTQYNDQTLIQAGADPNNDHGSALRFVLWGRTEVAAQPAAASVLTVASSQVSDNGSKNVIIRGVTTDGVRSETIPCNSSGSVSFTRVLKVTNVGTWAGTMTLTAGATTLLKLFSDEAGRTYQQIKFLQIPDAAEVVEYPFYRQPSPLVNDDDRPDIPSPYEELLAFDALLSFAAYNQYDQGVVKLWTLKQEALELGLQQTYDQAEALEAATPYTTYVPR